MNNQPTLKALLFFFREGFLMTKHWSTTKTRHYPNLIYCRLTVLDTGPTSTQYWLPSRVYAPVSDENHPLSPGLRSAGWSVEGQRTCWASGRLGLLRPAQRLTLAPRAGNQLRRIRAQGIHHHFVRGVPAFKVVGVFSLLLATYSCLICKVKRQ